MTRHRILQLITRADWGGAQRHVFDLATSLDRDRFEIIVACAPDGALVERLEAKHIQVIPIPSFQRGISLFRDFRARSEVCNLIHMVRPSIVHSHSSKAGIFGRWVAHEMGIPALYTAHGFAFGGGAASFPARAVYLATERLAGRFWTTCIITVSEADRRLALQRRIASADQVVTVHNGIDCTPYAEIPLPSLAGRELVVGVISRLVPGKGLVDLIEAAAVVLGHRSCRFVIAGEGPLRPKLEARARALRIHDRILFPGFVEPTAALKGIDIFVLPSLKEGLPYNILEAMAAGRPVIATPVGGIPEVIADGQNGRLVPVGNVRALADAIGDLALQHRLMQMGSLARRTVQERFNKVKMVGEIASIYERVLQ
ncbi:MAG TPA: glycosyltransferase family 4 protein [Symbiobacteriaceae bacterium]|nr:glycosyltransferase family 4 protein [Symbiobacteriaceae bacterium]